MSLVEECLVEEMSCSSPPQGRPLIHLITYGDSSKNRMSPIRFDENHHRHGGNHVEKKQLDHNHNQHGKKHFDHEKIHASRNHLFRSKGDVEDPNDGGFHHPDMKMRWDLMGVGHVLRDEINFGIHDYLWTPVPVSLMVGLKLQSVMSSIMKKEAHAVAEDCKILHATCGAGGSTIGLGCCFRNVTAGDFSKVQLGACRGNMEKLGLSGRVEVEGTILNVMERHNTDFDAIVMETFWNLGTEPQESPTNVFFSKNNEYEADMLTPEYRGNRVEIVDVLIQMFEKNPHLKVACTLVPNTFEAVSFTHHLISSMKGMLKAEFMLLSDKEYLPYELPDHFVRKLVGEDQVVTHEYMNRSGIPRFHKCLSPDMWIFVTRNANFEILPNSEKPLMFQARMGSMMMMMPNSGPVMLAAGGKRKSAKNLSAEEVDHAKREGEERQKAKIEKTNRERAEQKEWEDQLEKERKKFFEERANEMKMKIEDMKREREEKRAREEEEANGWETNEKSSVISHQNEPGDDDEVSEQEKLDDKIQSLEKKAKKKNAEDWKTIVIERETWRKHEKELAEKLENPDEEEEENDEDSNEEENNEDNNEEDANNSQVTFAPSKGKQKKHVKSEGGEKAEKARRQAEKARKRAEKEEAEKREKAQKAEEERQKKFWEAMMKKREETTEKIKQNHKKNINERTNKEREISDQTQEPGGGDIFSRESGPRIEWVDNGQEATATLRGTGGNRNKNAYNKARDCQNAEDNVDQAEWYQDYAQFYEDGSEFWIDDWGDQMFYDASDGQTYRFTRHGDFDIEDQEDSWINVGRAEYYDSFEDRVGRGRGGGKNNRKNNRGEGGYVERNNYNHQQGDTFPNNEDDSEGNGYDGGGGGDRVDDTKRNNPPKNVPLWKPGNIPSKKSENERISKAQDHPPAEEDHQKRDPKNVWNKNPDVPPSQVQPVKKKEFKGTWGDDEEMIFEDPKNFVGKTKQASRLPGLGRCVFYIT